MQVALKEYMEQYPPEVRAALVRGRLIQNVIDGEDVATKSARLLGLNKELNLWQDEQRNQVLVIQAPAEWQAPPPPRAIPPATPVSEDEMPEYE